MYSDYLIKVSMKKQNLNLGLDSNTDMDIDMQTDEQKQQILKNYELEETKEEKAKTMKTGEKYIIRKLISFKINIPKIDDYLQKLTSLPLKKDINTFNSSINNNVGYDNLMNVYSQPAPITQTQNMNGSYFNQVPPVNCNALFYIKNKFLNISIKICSEIR